jgi:hypothetical protein
VDDKTKPLQENCNSYRPYETCKHYRWRRKKIDLNNASLTEETTTENKDLKAFNNSAVFHQERLEKKVKENSLQKKAVVNEDLDKSGFNFWSWLWMAGAHYRCDRLGLLKQALYPN